MVQHAHGLDEIERTAESAELQDIRLGIVDLLETEFAGLASRIGEARAAQIHREHPRSEELLGDQDRMLRFCR